MTESATACRTRNQAVWNRLSRLFDRREKPVVAWISSNSQTLLQQNYRDFCERYSQKFTHLAVDANRLNGESLYLELQKSLAGQPAANVLFHIQRLADSPQQLAFEVNFEREQLFRKLPASIIFWSDEPSEIQWQQWAPDFWDWLVYRFHFEAELSIQADGALPERPLPSIGESKQNRAARLRERLDKLRGQQQAGRRQRLDYAETALSLAKTLVYLAQLSEARNLYQQTLDLFEQERDDLGLANALKSLGDLESRLGNSTVARTYFETAIGLYEKQQDDLGRANTLQSLGDLELRRGNPNAARTCFETAIGLYETQQDDLGRANALRSMGDLESRLGNPDAARACFETAIGLYEEQQNDLGRANALKSLGDLESRLGNSDAARTYFETSIGLYETQQDDLGRANTLRSLGDLELRRGNPDAARGCFETASGLYETQQVDLGRANALRSLGNLELRQGNPNAARGCFETAIGLYEKQQDDLGRANALRSLGNLAMAGEDFSSAQDKYAEAIALYRRVQEPIGLAYACAGLLRCHFALQQSSGLSELADQAWSAAKASGLDSVRKYVLEAMAEAGLPPPDSPR